MKALLRLGALALLVAQPQAQPGTQDDAAALADFARRVEAYAELHRCIEGPEPAIRVSADAAGILYAIESLGNRIRRARGTARPGDVFTPAIGGMIRRMIRDASEGRFAELLAIVQEDAPVIPAATVNGRWPSDFFPTMPVQVLWALPPLPDELEYRFIGRDLVLRDRYADVIVDVLPDAIPPITVP